MTYTVIIMVLELNSTPKVHRDSICSEETSCNAMPCRKKALHKLIKCSDFKQQALFIILLNSTAVEGFRVAHCSSSRALGHGCEISTARNGCSLPLFFFFFFLTPLPEDEQKKIPCEEVPDDRLAQ